MSFVRYPNIVKLYGLMQQLPEIIEMVAHTALNQQQQVKLSSIDLIATV